MAEVSGNDLKRFEVINSNGDKIKDLIAFNDEEFWYQINKRDKDGKLEKINGEQKRLRVYDVGMVVNDLVGTLVVIEPEVEAPVEAPIEGP